MPRTIENEPLQRHLLSLYVGDFAKLQAYYPEVTATVIVRKLVRKHIDALNRGLKDLPEEEIEL